MPHAYLLAGPQRTGKSTLAVNIAQAVNCAAPEPPCGTCPSCLRIAQGKQPDVATIQLPKDKSEIGIEQVHELQRSANLMPFEGRYKVFIINGAEQMSAEAANRLLKTLEEPPAKVLFVLLTSAPERVLPTILSRCLMVPMRPAPTAKIAKLLEQAHGQPHDKAAMLARVCRGSVGWAIEACSNERLLSKRSDTLADLISLNDEAWDQRFAYAGELAGALARNREEARETLALWESWWRDLLMVQSGDGADIANVDTEEELKRFARRYDAGQSMAFIQALEETWARLEVNASPRLALEVLMLSLPQPLPEHSQSRAAPGTSP